MKRIVSLFLCMVLVTGSFIYKAPKAEAFVFEGATIGSLYGSVMGSLGLSYASGGMNNQSFGQAIWDLMTGWFTETTPEGESALDFFGNLVSSGIQAMAPGKLLLNQSLIESISQFAQWIYNKYGLSENESAVVADGSLSFVGSTGTLFNLVANVSGVNASPYYVFPSVNPSATILYDLSVGGLVVWDYSPDYKLEFNIDDANTFSIRRYNKSSATYTKLQSYTVNSNSKGRYAFCVLNGKLNVAESSGTNWMCYGGNSTWVNTLADDLSMSPSLSVSAVNGLTISDVESVTPEQAYALTFEGVTASDVEGIINDAVGRILDGTFSATGEITNAIDVPQDLTWQEHLAQIWENIKALPQTIAQAISQAFTPDATLVEEITTTFNSKFGWLETIHQFGSDLFGMTAETQPPVIYIHLEDAEGNYTYGGTEKALDLSWYQRYKADVDHILSGFLWLAFLWLVFKRASSIIQGGEMITEYTRDIDKEHK